MAPRDSQRWTLRDTVALTVITSLAALVRVAHLASPASLVFDEDYYARDACTYVEASRSLCGAGSEVTTVHPPLAKWFIAGGIELFGFDPIGWRSAPVLAGTLTVLLLYILAKRILGSTLAASVASGALALDFLHVVMSRVAMLDVFVTLFATATALFVVLDRDAARANARTRHHTSQAWRAAAGIAAGGAIASKWSGLLVLGAALVLTVVWETARRKPAARAFRTALRDEWKSVGALMILLPAAVYAASYTRRLDATFLALPGSREWWPRAFAGQQLDMLRFHVDLHAEHVYASPAWSWFLIKRPVGFYFETADNGYREILALGNPVAWWLGAACIAYAAICLVRSRDVYSPALVIVVFVATTYVPWLLLGGRREVEFLYYVLPTVPFLCLALGFGAQQLVRRVAAGRWLVLASAAVISAAFVFYYPLLTARPLPYSSWKQRILFENCTRRDGALVPHVRHHRIEPRLGAGEAPSGWCWI